MARCIAAQSSLGRVSTPSLHLTNAWKLLIMNSLLMHKSMEFLIFHMMFIKVIFMYPDHSFVERLMMVKGFAEVLCFGHVFLLLNLQFQYFWLWLYTQLRRFIKRPLKECFGENMPCHFTKTELANIGNVDEKDNNLLEIYVC